MKFKRLGLTLSLALATVPIISLLNPKEVKAHCRIWHPHHCSIEEVVDDVTKTVDRWGLVVASPYLAPVPGYLESLYQQGNGRWRNLPNAFKARYRRHYGINLDEVKYATNINTGHGQAITVGKEIYFPTDINLDDPDGLHWMLHELEHVRQYQVVGGVSAFLVKYAVQGSMQIARNGSFNIHDNIQLEKEADAKADRLSASTKVQVCNARQEQISLAIALRLPGEEDGSNKVTNGWWQLSPGQCETFSYPNARVIYAMALLPGGSTLYPSYNGDSLDDQASFCINKANRMENLGVNACHGATDDKPYDFFAPGQYKFTNFGRISGLNSFTFR
jgi:hypothetical protein